MSDDGPDFTVIIPTWNRAQVVTVAVQSVLAQTGADFELIVVDDGSTDATLEVLLAESDPRLRVLCRDHEGVSVARNAGADAARGRNLAFLDSDDEAQPGWLAALSALLADPGIDVALCGAVVTQPDGNRYEIQPGAPGLRPDTVPTKFLAGCYALRRQLFEAVGGFDQSLGFGENTELALRLFTHHTQPVVAAATFPLVRQRAPAKRALATRAASARTVLDRYNSHRRQFPRLWGSYQAIAGVDSVRNGRYWEGRRHFVRALRADPWTIKHALRLVLSLVPGGSWLAWRRRSRRSE